MTMPTTYYEVAARFFKDDAGAEEALKQIFFGLGYDESALTVTLEKRYGYIKVYCSTPRAAKKITDRLYSLHLKKVKVLDKVLGAADWRDKWKKDIRPFRLTKRFDVVPSWSPASIDKPVKGRTPIILDTTLAFGTGLHETTRFSAQLVERCAGTYQTFLDIGTGTGLLSIVAARCGAGTLRAVDIDRNSIETAQRNLKANGLVFDWCAVMDFAKFRRKKMFDFVAANVITDELIRMKDRIVAVVRPGGHLVVSGISLKNLPRFKRAFADQPLRCVRILKGKKWAAILYKRKDEG